VLAEIKARQRTPAERAAQRRAAGQAAEEAFARSVKRLREARGWTRAELAAEAGIGDPGTVSRIEATGRPGSLRTAHAIALALDTTVGAMIRAGAR
jgi:DNA-binding XRE family transcriptional regulator